MEEIEIDGAEAIDDPVYQKLLGRLAQVERFHVLFEADRLTVAWDGGGEARVTTVTKEQVLTAGTVDGLLELLETEAAIVNFAG